MIDMVFDLLQMNGKPSATSTQYDDDTESMVNTKPLSIFQDAQADPILETIRQREKNSCTQYSPQSQFLFDESQQIPPLVYTPQRQPLPLTPRKIVGFITKYFCFTFNKDSREEYKWAYT